MGKTIRRLLMVSAVFAVAACAEPFPPYYYAAPAPPPLQPYMEPAVAAPAHVTRRVAKRHYVRRHRRVRCRCIPAS
jgi:hypothetical protein